MIKYNKLQKYSKTKIIIKLKKIKSLVIKTFKSQSHKMVKHTQTIRRLLPTNCLSVFDHFVGLTLKGLTSIQLKCLILKL